MPPSQPGGRHATSLPGVLPAPPLDAWRRPEASPVHSPPSRAPSSPLSPVSSPPEEHAGAPSSTRVAIDAEKPQERVQALRRRRLRRTAEGIEPGARVDAGFFLEFPLAAVKDFVDSAAVEPPQPSPPPLLSSG